MLKCKEKWFRNITSYEILPKSVTLQKRFSQHRKSTRTTVNSYQHRNFIERIPLCQVRGRILAIFFSIWLQKTVAVDNSGANIFIIKNYLNSIKGN